MAGTHAGGLIAAQTNKELYGKDFYSKIGVKGGSVSNPNKGFASMDKEKIREAGRKGGSISKRKPAWY